MNQSSCHANLWLVTFSVFMCLFSGSIVASTCGDEPKGTTDSEQLEQWLRGVTDQELISLANEGTAPATIGELHVSPGQLSHLLIREMSRRLETQKTQPAEATEIKRTATADSKADGGDQVDDQGSGEDMPVGPAEIKLQKAAVETFLGDPFSTGNLDLQFQPGHGPVIYPDQQLFLDTTDNRAHYITFDLSYQQHKGEPTMMVDRIRVHFLLRGVDPCQVSLSSVNEVFLDKQDLNPIQDDNRHRELLGQWWKQFSVIPTSYGREQRELKESLLDIMTRRLQLLGPWPKTVKHDNNANETSLEHQFERGIGMLFGIESVKLAMSADTALNQSGRIEKANQPVPPRPVLQSVRILQAPADTWIEPIAMHVPAECFYLRTGSLANYRQFRKFLVGWGGSLNDIVSTGAVNHQSRERIEGQLGISADQFAPDEFDKLISDMALIGCDPMFDDGASVGILFQARDSNGLDNVLKLQRNQTRSRVPESEDRRVTVEGREISFLTSDDQRIRSYYAIDGDFHLVTNSYHLLSRFLQASNGTGSLGTLNEFRYARHQANEISKKNQQQPLAMLYLSDPFFQSLVSPHYRIELTRRRQAARELKQYQLALMIAKAEHIDAVTTDQLIESKLLPAGFGTRPDGSYPMLNKEKLSDSTRGALGYFLPIPDVPVQNATQTEVRSYHQFMAHYNQEWRRIDPVTVVFSRGNSDNDGHQQVGLDIVITPYAQQHYALLSQHLAPAIDQRVAPMNDDLISLDTSIRSGQGSSPSFFLYFGLRDDDVSYVFKNGQIRLANGSNGGSFAKSNSYLAISPLALFSFSVAYQFLYSIDVIDYVSSVSSNQRMMVVSNNQSLRQKVLNEISGEEIRDSSQVRLRVKSLASSKVEPYIQAYTYLASRKASSENAKFLNDFTSWLRLPITESRDSVETVLGAQLRCPLGGDFGLNDHDGHSYWTGTRWPEASYFAETKTPASWKFAFLDWLRGLDLRFDIDQTTLRAHVDMVVRQSVGHGGDDRWTPLKLQGSSNPVNSVAANKVPVVVQAGFQTMPRWVLGIRGRSVDRTFHVTHVYPDSPASRAGLLVGDQIIEVDGVKPESSKRLAALIESARDGKGTLFVRLRRNGAFSEHVVGFPHR